MKDQIQALEAASRAAVDFLNSLETRSVAAGASGEELRALLGKECPVEGMNASRVVEELARAAEAGILGSQTGRFFAWVIGGSLPSALAADWLTSAWDQNTGLYACAPAASMIEEIAGTWLKQILGLPEHASFAFTTGCEMAHFTCLAAARHAVLEQAGWDVEKRGLVGAPAIRVVSSTGYHGSFLKALRMVGLGSDSLYAVEVDESNRVRVPALQAVLEQHADEPTILVLQAGEINTGAFDEFASVIPIARGAVKNLWIHVDGAFGLWAQASKRFRHFGNGVELADSWATDGHKWLNVPYDCGYAFVARPEPHRGAMALHASYLTHDVQFRDAIDWTPEWSRRARGIPTYAAIRELGTDGIERMVDRCCDMAALMLEKLSQVAGVEVLWRPVLNQGLVRFLDPSGKDHDAYTDLTVERINATGEAFFSPSTWRGMRVMRISVSNWRTNESDVERTVRAIEQSLPVAIVP